MKATGILVIAVFTLVLIAGCDKKQKLMPNTEAYIQAHGIEQGKVNTLQIGGTLFRFPAGVGLNPYTYDRENIVKGHVDRVIFFLNSKRNYAPGEDPYQSGDVLIKISKFGGPPSPNRFEASIRDMPITVEHPELGLREYKSNKAWMIGSVYESVLPKLKESINGGPLFFVCQDSQASRGGGTCATSYWRADGQYTVAIGMDGPFFLKHWQEAYPAAVQFVNSVVVK